MDLPIPLHVAKINAQRRIVNSYFDEYVEKEMNPTVEGFITFMQDTREVVADEINNAKWETEQSLYKEFV